MQLNIDLCDLPEAKAHAILIALASCFTGDTETKTDLLEPKSTETIGNKLKRETEERNAQDKPAQAQTDNGGAPPLTIVDVDLSSGPPDTSAAEDLGNDSPGAATTNTPAPNVDLDAQGMPWDERIHVGTKTKMGSGPRNQCWKYKPKTDATLIEQVEAELMSGRPATQQATGANEAKPDTAEHKDTQEVGEVVQHIFNAKEDFGSMLKMVTGDVTSGKVPQGASSCISRDMEFTNIMAIGERPDRYQEFADKWVALRQMIVLDPNVAQQVLTDWPGVSAMLAMAD